jgi:uncharacterized surface anchored protein
LTVATLPVLGSTLANAATVGGFEIDGNMVSDGAHDWATVGGQPSATDGTGANETLAFVPGNSAKELKPENWDLNNDAVSPEANDIADLYSHSATDASGDQFIFFGFEREKNTGTISYSIELNQLPNMTNENGVSIPDRSVGDVLISVTQQGGSVFSIDGVYTWSGSGWSLVPGGIAHIVGDTNDAPITDIDGNTLPTGRFLEISVNLTDLFNVPSCPGKNFEALNVRSRASQSVSSDGKDYVAPVTIDVADTCGDLTIEKYDEDGVLLPGATFSISPNPIPLQPNAPALVVTDGGTNDPDGLANGIIYFEDAKPADYTVTETAAPPGYIMGPDPVQTGSVEIVDGAGTSLVLEYTNELGSAYWEKVDATSGEKICCAEFLLEATGGDAAGLFSSVTVVDNGAYDADPDAGEILVEDLFTGSYTVTETAAPTGYRLADPAQSFDFTINGANPDFQRVNPVENERKRSRLAVLKLDEVTQEELQGAAFTLWSDLGPAGRSPEDTVIDNCVTGATGTCEIGGLDFGTYYWEETDAPTGYELPGNVYSDPIIIDASNAGGLISTVTFEDPQTPSELTVEKVDEVDGATLQGAEFTLWRDGGDAVVDSGDETVVDTCTTGPTGRCAIGNLGFGDYYWEETAAPAGYGLPAGAFSAMITIDAANAGAVLAVTTFKDPRKPSSLRVEKLDAVDAAPLAGAEFTLWNTEGTPADLLDDTAVGTCTTGANGLCTVQDLDFGTYYLEETAAPKGYELPADVYSELITIDAANAGGLVATVTFEDPRKVSSLRVNKVDQEDTALLAGADFTLWRDGGDGIVDSGDEAEAGSCTTVADGLCTVGDLGFGSYYWEETAAPTGYELPADVYSELITIDAANAGGLVSTVTFEDPRTPSELSVRKVDEVDSSALAGAEFTLWRDGGDGVVDSGDEAAAGSCIAAADGLCSVGGLDFGGYYWEETAAPEGYDLPVDSFSAMVTIDASNAGTSFGVVTFADPRKLSELAVEKVDAVDDSPLPGATFELWLDSDAVEGPSAGDTSIATCSTDNAGSCSIDGLDFGSYYWEEISPPTGYELPAVVYSDLITIDATNAGATLPVTTFEDDRLQTELAVQKLDEGNEAFLDGAEFSLWKDDGDGVVDAQDTEIGTCTTGDGFPTGTCTIEDLDFGTYYWEETAAPEGYDLPADVYSAMITISASNAGTTLPLTTFEDPRKPSELAVAKVDAQDETPLAGATFELWLDGDHVAGPSDGDTSIGTCVSTGAGVCSIDGLDFGTYYWEETAAPTGYLLPGDVYSDLITIDATNAGTTLPVTTFADPRKVSELTVEKLDEANGVPLSGADFALWDADGTPADRSDDTVVDTCTTDAGGTCTIGALDFGTYYWEETAPPTGYELPADVYSELITIDASNAGTDLVVSTFEDPRVKSSLRVKKVDEQDGTVLAGASFTLWLDGGDGIVDSGDETAAGTCTTEDNGRCAVRNLDFGTYYWEETAAPTGYDLPDDVFSELIEIEASNAGELVTTVTFEDPRKESELAVEKLDEVNGALLAGATFELWLDDDGVVGPSDGDTSIETCVTDDSGRCAVDGLDFGTYYWEETAAPTGYDLPNEVYSDLIVISAGNAGTEFSVATFEDPRIPSELSVLKLDATDDSPLAGAEFALFEVNGTPEDTTDDVEIGSCTSGADGTCTIGGLDFGTYYWVETTPPTGYESADPATSEVITIDAPSAGTVLPVTTFRNDQVPTNLGVEKVDAVDGSLLAGATFELYSDADGSGDPSEGDGAAIATCTTDATGTCTVESLLFGDYYWRETAAPTGYDLPADVYSDIVTVNAENAGTVMPVTTFEDPRKLSRIEALKVDAETGDPLAGAVFQLWMDNGDGVLDTEVDTPVGDPKSTGGDGTTLFSGLTFGDYIVEEIEAPEGYYLPVPHPTQLVSITVDNAGGLFEVTFEDPRLGSLLVRKQQLLAGEPLPSGEMANYADPITYEITVSGAGPGTQHNVVVTDYVPGFAPDDTTSTTQAIYIAGSQACQGEGKCVTKYDARTGKLTWRLGNLDAGGSRTVEFSVRIPLPDEVLSSVPGTYEDRIWNVAVVASVENEPKRSNPVRTGAVAEVEAAEPPAPKPPLPPTGAAAGMQAMLGIGALAVLTGASLILSMRRRKPE